jgi:hypothetical protein
MCTSSSVRPALGDRLRFARAACARRTSPTRAGGGDGAVGEKRAEAGPEEEETARSPLAGDANFSEGQFLSAGLDDSSKCRRVSSAGDHGGVERVPSRWFVAGFSRSATRVSI